MLRERKVQLIVASVFLAILSLMTVGYAAKDFLFSISGRVDMELSGDIYIKDVAPVDIPNLSMNMTSQPAKPNFSKDQISLDLKYERTNPDFQEGEINFLVTVQNDLAIKRCFYRESAQLNFSDINGNESFPESYAFYLFDETGVYRDFNNCIEPKSSAKFILSIVITPSSSMLSAGAVSSARTDFKLLFTGEEPGRLLTRVRSESHELRTSDDASCYFVDLINSYKSDKTVNVDYDKHSSLYITGEDGRTELTPSQLTITANSTKSSKYCVRLKPNVKPAEPLVYMQLNYSEASSGSKIPLEPFKVRLFGDIVHTDNEAPMISNFNLSYNAYKGDGNTDAGDLVVGWAAEDQSLIDKIYIELLRREADGSFKRYIGYVLGGRDTAYHFHDLPAGEYQFRIYGLDAYGNKPSMDQCRAPADANEKVPCLLTAPRQISWRVGIGWNLSHIRNAKDMPVGAWRGKMFEINFIPDKAWYNATHTKLYGRYPEEAMTHVHILHSDTETELINNNRGVEIAKLAHYSYNEKTGLFSFWVSENGVDAIAIQSRARVCWLGWSDV